MTFDEFVAPIGEARFIADHYGQAPVHIPAAEVERLCFTWARMNAILAQRSHWTPGNIKLILNSRAVEPHFYLDDVPTLDGPQRRADPAKIDLFMAMGASLVANSVDEIAPEIAGVAEMLGRQFGGPAAANIYCSFDNIQAFATHYDDHEVFAVQCEGEKSWRIYANRADAPIGPHEGSQADIDAARGDVALDVLMRPGDLLYIPRGQYHDAIAREGASLHVTFSVMPRPGVVLAPLIEAAMARDPAFRAYLPSPDDAGGQPFVERLAALADRLQALVKSPGFAIEVADAQRRMAVQPHPVSLPVRVADEHYLRTTRPFRLERTAQGLVLHGSRPWPLGPTFAAAEWALARPAFGVRELNARFRHVPEPARRQLVALLVREGLVERYYPTTT